VLQGGTGGEAFFWCFHQEFLDEIWLEKGGNGEGGGRGGGARRRHNCVVAVMIMMRTWTWRRRRRKRRRRSSRPSEALTLCLLRDVIEHGSEEGEDTTTDLG